MKDHKGHDGKHHAMHMGKDGNGPGMAHKGDDLGNMSPKVDDYQKPMSGYSQKQFSKTLDYIDRQDAFVAKETSNIERQDYKGRYS
jgi:hypothetical protein